MIPAKFSCPACLTSLRIRDPELLDHEIRCPDCGIALRVTRAADQTISATQVQNASDIETVSKTSSVTPSGVTTSSVPDSPRGPKTATRTRRELSRPRHQNPVVCTVRLGLRRGRSMIGGLIHSPVAVAWLVTSFCTAIFVIVVWPGDAPRGVDISQYGNSSPPGSDPVAQGPVGQDTVEPGPNEPDSDGASPQRTTGVRMPETFEGRLRELGRQLSTYHSEHGAFPKGASGTPDLDPDQRLSWLAELAVAADTKNQRNPVRTRSWRDPLNDRFVRRGLPLYQNPQLTQLVSPDRYPATHIVGIAGVGSDAAVLPAQHPRAGIFGLNRQTKHADIKDGLANTMLAAGVQDQLGAWAAGGPATIRSFDHEPYVNGPDGFGSGSLESMNVLMADGSVRSISRNTDPTIVRRMAAIADGLPLNADVPGEPGDRGSSSPPAASATDIAQAVETPTETVEGGPVVVVPPARDLKPADHGDDDNDPPGAERPINNAPAPEPAIDIANALRQPIARFEQTRPIPFSQFLLQLEEMVGVPIRFSPAEPVPDDSLLAHPVSVQLRDTTLEQIMTVVLQQMHLSYRLTKNAVHLVSIDGYAPKENE